MELSSQGLHVSELQKTAWMEYIRVYVCMYVCVYVCAWIQTHQSVITTSRIGSGRSELHGRRWKRERFFLVRELNKKKRKENAFGVISECSTCLSLIYFERRAGIVVAFILLLLPSGHAASHFFHISIHLSIHPFHILPPPSTPIKEKNSLYSALLT